MSGLLCEDCMAGFGADVYDYRRIYAVSDGGEQFWFSVRSFGDALKMYEDQYADDDTWDDSDEITVRQVPSNTLLAIGYEYEDEIAEPLRAFVKDGDDDENWTKIVRAPASLWADAIEGYVGGTVW